MLCKYANLFGQPGQQAHSIRFGNLAVVDIVLTVIVAWATSKYFNLSFPLTLITFFILGIIAHRLFCVRTQVDKYLFPN